MNRVIIPEEHAKEEQVEHQSTIQQSVVRSSNDYQSNNQKSITQQSVKQKIANIEKVTISSAELEQIFYEWDLNGKNDLTIDGGDIAKKIEAYLAYQETLKPLKIKLAEEQFERFLVESVDEEKSEEARITLNRNFVETAMLFSKNSVYGYMNFEDFRLILCACKNPYAYYPYKNEKRIIDVRGWVLEHGGNFEKTHEYVYIEFPSSQPQEELSWLQRVLKKMGMS